MKEGWTYSVDKHKCIICGHKTTDQRTIRHGSIKILVSVCANCDYLINVGYIDREVFKSIREKVTYQP